MRSLTSAMFFALALIVPMHAGAAPITVDFAVDTAASRSLTFGAADGWSVSVTPGFVGSPPADSGYPLAQSYLGGGGVGVFHSGGDAHTIDNVNGSEFLRFQFQQGGQDRNVQVSSVTVSCVGCDFANSDADASWRAGSDVTGAWNNEYVATNGFLYTFNLANITLSNFFLFGASRENLDQLIDSFKVHSITFLSLQPVSEPSVFAAIILGMFLMTLAQRTNRRALSRLRQP